MIIIKINIRLSNHLTMCKVLSVLALKDKLTLLYPKHFSMATVTACVTITVIEFLMIVRF